MLDLDNIEKIKKLDAANVVGSLELLYKQIEQAYVEASKIEIPQDYKNVKNVVAVGMGGSGYAPSILHSLILKKTRIPYEVFKGYDVPGYVGENTLVLLSSHSGTTEEPLAFGEEAKRRGAKILGATIGRKLGEFLTVNNYPAYIYKEGYNPSGQPRMAFGYQVMGEMVLLGNCGVVEIKEEEVRTMISHLAQLSKLWGLSSPLEKNEAKKVACEFFGKIPIIAAAEFLEGNSHALRNQINENSKNFSAYFPIPEINHHLMEGLSFPKDNPDKLVFLFINSNLYRDLIRVRFKATKYIVEKYKVKTLEFVPQGETEFIQCFETLLFGGYVSFYLAMSNEINPAPIPWVDYFKEQLTEYRKNNKVD